MTPRTMRRLAHAATVASLLGLIALTLAWELWLAPLRPGGSWLVIKALPLLAPVFGVLHGRLYTLRWSPMLLVPYFIEGAMRAWADEGLSARLALIEAGLVVVFCAGAIVMVRRKPRAPRAPASAAKQPDQQGNDRGNQQR